jgi:hypothetical protein
MFSSKVIGAALAAACLAAIGTMPAAGPRADRGDMGGWSARQNRIESRRYARLVATDPAFRRYRERIECGPITLPKLREECLQSFPHSYMGGSMAPRPYASYYGR